MLPLDADSVMSGPTIVRMARMMQAHPRLGILQSLVVAMPTESAFARIFQFGMRAAMRSYTTGQAWWTADCGPFWGHSALVRIKPFVEHCTLPDLPGRPPLGGPVLSHDQVEAALMCRAGYEVRVLPEEVGSWEENPPTVREHVRRDQRWCEGNLQYVRLIGMPGLRAASRFHLFWAILMFAGIPARTLILALLPLAAWQARAIADFPTGLAAWLLVALLVMGHMPRIAGFVDIVLTPGRVAAYGGWRRLAPGIAIELAFDWILGAITSLRTTIHMVGLVFGRSVGWRSQSRDAHAQSLRDAAADFWPHLAFGCAVVLPLLAIAPAVALWTLPLTAGYFLAIPFAVATADPALARRLSERGICAFPEDFVPPAEIAAIRRAPA
jgi:membrane glycosyltransferase